jgi:hypothetical protein
MFAIPKLLIILFKPHQQIVKRVYRTDSDTIGRLVVDVEATDAAVAPLLDIFIGHGDPVMCERVYALNVHTVTYSLITAILSELNIRANIDEFDIDDFKIHPRDSIRNSYGEYN